MHGGEILSGKLKVVPVVPTRQTFLSGMVTCCLARSLRDENGAVLLSEYIAWRWKLTAIPLLDAGLPKSVTFLLKVICML